MRGIAVALVVMYHGWPDVLPGGAYGVTIFFVLSGYLITQGLIREPVDLGRFYARRAARLLPCLLFVSAASVAFGGAVADAWPALGYVSNWRLIAGDQLGLMTHTWSLSVEEHFYLAWPLVILVIPARFRFSATTALLALAAVWRGAMIAGGATFERVTVGTDTAAVALIAGCLLAVAHAEGRRMGRGRAVPVLLAMLAMAAFIPGETDTFLWGGFVIVPLSAVLIEAGTRPVRVLEFSWLRWLGTVSYGLYLWHHLLTHLGLPMWAGVGLSVAVAALSWRALEVPAMRWASGRLATRPVAVDTPGTGRRVLVPVLGATNGGAVEVRFRPLPKVLDAK